MTTYPKNIEGSFKRLADLLSIPLERGWKTAVAAFFDVPLSLLLKWRDRGNIPKKRLRYAHEKGYDPKVWYVVEDDAAMETESLSRPASGGLADDAARDVNVLGLSGVGAVLKLNLDTICEKYPQLRYALMFAQDDNVEELHRVIVKWAEELVLSAGSLGVSAENKIGGD
jgi:hypothetical protein